MRALDGAPIEALALSGAMHSVLALDAHDRPLAPALTWADQRAASSARTLRAQTDPLALYRRTGCPLQVLYYPAKLRWCVDHFGARLARVVALKEAILHRLTGLWASDHGLASTTGLLDTRSLRWDEEALALAGVTAAHLPPLVPSATIVGTLRQGSAASGLPEGLPVVAGGSDGGMAMVGMPTLKPIGERQTSSGVTVVNVGTSGAIRRVVNTPFFDPAAHVVLCARSKALARRRRHQQRRHHCPSGARETLS